MVQYPHFIILYKYELDNLMKNTSVINHFIRYHFLKNCVITKNIDIGEFKNHKSV